ncbi:polysaccharide deacetylase family protein [Bradyrhizobium sp.]|uniref:polysaccharide deacetylase family protein n=1 Tax=Bradyrhizobium sp. TaxID=376 RepID=UPI0025BE1E05|nr:polysaccharide deacetylase family protein [Bradyrhizobium sp.]
MQAWHSGWYLLPLSRGGDLAVPTPFSWPAGRKCAVSITYDDALPVHYELAGPALEAHGLRGTFYLNIAAGPSHAPLPWRELAARGHELGNHSLFHPCRRGAADRRWIDKAFDLRQYTPHRFQQEVGIANAFLQLIDGRSERSYAYTCFDTHIGRWRTRTPIAGMIRDKFIAARGARTDQPIAVSRDLDLMNLGGFLADTLPLSALTDAVKRAGDESSWLILVIDGIGAGTHNSFVEPSIHHNLLDFLASESSTWVAPVIEIAKWVRRENEEALHLTK